MGGDSDGKWGPEVAGQSGATVVESIEEGTKGIDSTEGVEVVKVSCAGLT